MEDALNKFFRHLAIDCSPVQPWTPPCTSVAVRTIFSVSVVGSISFSRLLPLSSCLIFAFFPRPCPFCSHTSACVLLFVCAAYTRVYIHLSTSQGGGRGVCDPSIYLSRSLHLSVCLSIGLHSRYVVPGILSSSPSVGTVWRFRLSEWSKRKSLSKHSVLGR